jgi:predicted DCC family thiol-disulfide oxidoreductase YuxK
VGTISKLAAVVVVVGLLALAIWQRERLRATVIRFFTEPDGPFNIAVARIVYFTVVLLALPSAGTVKAFAALPDDLVTTPANGGHLLVHLPRSAELIDAVHLAIVVAAILGLLGIVPRLAAAVVVLGGFYFFGIPQLYGKVDHDHHLLWIGLVFCFARSADALSLQAVIQAWRRPSTAAVGPVERSLAFSLPLRFIWLVMGMVYLFAGLAKYRFDGLEWLKPATLAHWLHLLWYETGLRPPLLHRPDKIAVFLIAGAGFTLLFECGWIFAVFSRRVRPVLAFAGLAFHNSTNFLMRISFWNLQLFYITLIDWDGVSRWVWRRRDPMWFAYDGNCGICKKTAVALRSLALPGGIRFVNALDRQGLEREGLAWLDEQAVVHDVHVVVGRRAFLGYEAYRRAAYRIPVLWAAIPLLYLAPVAGAGHRLYRRVADSRRCRLRQPATDPPAKQSRMPVAMTAAVGALVAALLINGVVGLRSSSASARSVNGWPVASYPSFAGVGNSTVEFLEAYAPTRNGLERVDLRGRLGFMSSGQFYGMLDSVMNGKRGAERVAAITALVRYARPTDREGRPVTRLVIRREFKDLDPDRLGRVLHVEHIQDVTVAGR